MRTFLELQNEALADDFDATKYRARVKTWINEGLSRIARNIRLPGLEATAKITLVAGTNTYALPADSLRVTSLRRGSTILEAIDIGEIDEQAAASGEPGYYALYAGQVRLYPTPSVAGSLDLRYEKDAATLASDPDVPAIPEDYADLLVTYARYKLFRAEDDPEMASFYIGEWQRELALMKGDVQLKGRRPRQIAGMWR